MNGFDNAVNESFFGTLKAEHFHIAQPSSVDELEAGVHDYVNYYNHVRTKLRLKGISPVEYRLKNTAYLAALQSSNSWGSAQSRGDSRQTKRVRFDQSVKGQSVYRFYMLQDDL